MITRTPTRRRFVVLLAVSIVLASLTNAVIAWTLGRVMWKRTPVPFSASIDFGADRVSIGGYECVGTTFCYWQPQAAQAWHFNPQRLDANKIPWTRPADPALSRPWKTQSLPNWVPDWSGFAALQSTPRRVEEVWSCAQGWPLLSFHCSFFETCLVGNPPRMTYVVQGGIPLANKIHRTPGGPIYIHYSTITYTPI